MGKTRKQPFKNTDTIAPVKKSEGIIRAVTVASKDTTSRELAEDAVQLSKQQSESCFESIGDAIYVLNTDTGRIMNCNAQACLDLGYDKDELLKLYATDIECKLSSQYVNKLHHNLKPGEVETIEGVHKRKDGSVFPVEIRLSLMSPSGSANMIAVARNVTKRKLAEESLLESEAKYRALSSTVDYLILVDSDLRYLFANEAYLNLFVPEGASVIGRLYGELHDEESTRIFTDAVKCVLETGNPYQDEWFGRRSGRHLLRTFSSVKQIDKGLATMTVAVKDITDRKQIEYDLRRSEENFRSLASTTDSLFLVDSNHKMIFGNENFIKRTRTHYSGPIIGEPIDAIFHPSKAIEIRKGVDAVFSTGTPYYDETWGHYAKIYFVRTFSPVFDENKNVTAVTVAAKDMMERKLAEDKLKQSEEKYRSLAFVADRTFVVDRDCRYLFANDNYLNLLGCKADQLIGRKYDEFHDKKRTREFADAVKSVFETGNVYQAEYRGRRMAIYFLQKFSPIRNSDGNIDAVTIISIDITDRKLAEMELEKHRQHLESMVEERTAELEKKNIVMQELNMALKVLLIKREDDKKDLEERFVMNIQNLIIPYVEQLQKSSLDVRQQSYLDIIAAHLREITTPLLKNMRQFNLTPKETKVATLVTQGKTTKEIGKILGLASGSISIHRKNLRKKLGLHNRNANLLSYLANLNQ